MLNKLIILIIIIITNSCGSHEEYEKWQEEMESQERAESEHQEDKTEESVTYDESIEIYVDHAEYLYNGASMDEVEYILGAPDNSTRRQGGGIIWHYYSEDICDENHEDFRCAIVFDKKGFLDYTLHVNPKFKDYKNY